MSRCIMMGMMWLGRAKRRGGSHGGSRSRVWDVGGLRRGVEGRGRWGWRLLRMCFGAG